MRVRTPGRRIVLPFDEPMGRTQPGQVEHRFYNRRNCFERWIKPEAQCPPAVRIVSCHGIRQACVMSGDAVRQHLSWNTPGISIGKSRTVA